MFHRPAYEPSGQRLDKIAGSDFEHHVLCDGPKGEGQEFVLKNCLEQFFTTEEEPEGLPTGKWAIILPGAPYNDSYNKQLSVYLVAAF